MSTLIMKFGGSTVGTTSALTQVLSIVLHESTRFDRLMLVVSALDGVTDALIEAAHLAQLSNSRGYRRIAATVRHRHLALIEKLPLGTDEKNALQADIDRLLFDMLNTYQNIANAMGESIRPDVMDSVLSIGERLATRIVAALLRQNNVRGVAVDTHDLIITDDIFGNASPFFEKTQARIDANLMPMLDRNIVPVLTGFIGGTESGKITTLGRGGSDYSASTFAVCAKADEVWMWTDVDGIMSSDPEIIPEAQVIPELSYEEMAELAYFGARVIHPRMVAPLKEHLIPLRIKNVFKPQKEGTLVHNIPKPLERIKAVTSIQGVALSAARSGSVSEISSIVDDLLFKTIGTRADVMLSSQSSASSLLCFVIPTSAGHDAIINVESHLNERLKKEHVDDEWTVQPVTIITAIGSELNGFTNTTGKILQALHGIRLFTLAQGPTWCSLSLVISPQDSETALKRIHTLTLSSD